MTTHPIENLNILSEEPILTPNALKQMYPLTPSTIRTVKQGQQTIKNILHRRDSRLLVITGPCSIHDVASAREYAARLRALCDELCDKLYLVMRVYFEKPRTTTGWQGLVIDPFLDGSCVIEEGLKMSRALLSHIAELGLPAAGEALDIVTPPFIQDLFSWTAIGARTTESQSHRKMASGLTATVGFKNGTDGNIDIALHALQSVAAPHNFVSINPEGNVSVIRTSGNPNTHIILRGGKTPNFDAEHIARYEQKLRDAKIEPRIMIDCSHANSNKQPENQATVVENVIAQKRNGNQSIIGIMLESHLHAGSQPILRDPAELKYGVSITDPCIDFETTERLLRKLHRTL
ncbi:MAG: 3-deoxy-7-phosphoheptulonate synthase [Deltaproteobacteria bacterium]|nr:3-deoxy-7-phosphoheptulonate synthase [Deltaproteobacteria bacterium]MBN2674804.1 3-deoxy-7-phosphoheptulonate synthase [Deltaproteobacteria bacterium]